MKKTFLLLFLIVSLKIFSQEKTFVIDSNKIHQEKIFIHLNTNSLLTGETLLYKISCLNKLNNQYSNLSKIAYIEILNDKKERISQQKIELKNGTGQGDFFIRNSLKTGNYKIISYTKWMKNKNYFTATDLYIINPYQPKIKKSSAANTLKIQNHTAKVSSTLKNNIIVLNKKEYSKREKVSFSINLHKKEITSNNLSVSVRKIENQFYSQKKNSLMFLQEKSKAGISNDKITDTPDIRGDIIKGQVISKSNNKPVEDIKVSLSIIQRNGFFLISNTDKNGYFYFIIDNFRKTEKSYIQLIDATFKDYKIILAKESLLNFDHLTFKKLNTTNLLDSLIDKKSTYIQIENAYKNLKQDQISIEKVTSSIPNYLFKKYSLDNFTRFKTIEETLIEIIPNTWSNTSKDNTTFHVYVNDNTGYNRLPLLLIDGFIVNNHNELANIKMNTVDAINISHNIFKFNSVIYKGIISINTYKGEYEPKTRELLSINLKQPLANKKYFFQNYSKSNNKRIPDFRTQLFWDPNLNVSQKEISFFTSDVSGNFEIEIEGFTNDGEPISLRKNFKVK